MAQNPVLINSFFTNDQDSLFLSAGTIAFYDNTVRTQLKPIYRDSALSIPFPNPLTLDAIGSAPPIYLPDNETYYVLVKDRHGVIKNELEGFTSFFVNDLNLSVSSSNNLITNPSFEENYDFTKNDKGYIASGVTTIASGWEFDTDEGEGANTAITFVSTSSSMGSVKSLLAVDVKCTTATLGTTRKDLVNDQIANVNSYDGARLSYRFEARTLSSGLFDVLEIFLKKNFGLNGSDIQYIKIGEHRLTSEFQIYSGSHDLSVQTGKTYGTGNSLSFVVRLPLIGGFNVQLTSFFVAQGDVPVTDFYSDSSAIEQSKIIAKELQDINIGDDNSFNSVVVGSSKFNYGFTALQNTGEISLYTKGTSLPYNVLPCDGRSLKITDYSDNGIPYSRLYGVIKNAYGSTGDITSTVDDKTANSIITKLLEGREKSVTGAGTLGSKVSFTQISKGLEYEAYVTVTTRSVNGQDLPALVFESPEPYVSIKSYNGAYFDINRAPWGVDADGSPFHVYDVNQGSATVKPKNSIVFDAFSGAANMRTRKIERVSLNDAYVTYPPSICWNDINSPSTQWFPYYYGSFSSYRKPKYSLSFTVDGIASQLNPYSDVQITFDFSSKLSLEDNLKNLATFMSKGTETRITFSGYPSDNEYFFISSQTVDYYVWYDAGSGVDPAISNRTGIKIDIPQYGIGSLKDVVDATNNGLNTSAFRLPAEADLPALPATPKVLYGITL